MPLEPQTSDDTLARLYTLAARLTERIGEGEDARARLTRALTASAWPDVKSAGRYLPRITRRSN